MIRLPWTVARTQPKPAPRREVRPSVEGLEGRLLLSKKGTAAIARARLQASNSPDVPPLDTPIPTITAHLFGKDDPAGRNVVFSRNVTLNGITSAHVGVVYLGRGERGAFTRDTISGGDGYYSFDIVAKPGDNLVRVFAASSVTFGVPSQYSPPLTYRFTVADAVVGWNAIATQAIQNQKVEAVEAARDLATLHVAQYDAIASIRSPGSALHGAVAAPHNASEAAAANAAAYTVLARLFPGQVAMFDTGLANARDSLPKNQATRDGFRVGRNAGNSTVEWRAADPTAPFVVSNLATYAPAAPPAAGSAAFDAALAEVQADGGTVSLARTARQTQTARFWADYVGTSTNPGQWTEAAGRLAVQQRSSLWTNARTFALLSTAMADAGTVSQTAKNLYQVPHPQSTIQKIDPQWVSLLPTGGDFSYPSDQAAYASAAAGVLNSVFGPKTSLTLSSADLQETRVYATPDEAATDAADSGIFGGVQYRFDVSAGTQIGTDVSRDVLASFPTRK